jgi:hypothetical protein
MLSIISLSGSFMYHFTTPIGRPYKSPALMNSEQIIRRVKMLNTATTPQTKVTPKPILLNNPQKPLPIIFNETRFAYVDEMFVLSAGIFDAC